ncbi:MAG: hypothetical protein QOG64_2655, partial [Acidimicrobiaceae bacterium]|nr:hypothetical protein [Acidimicrobiaceae bacterium]
MDEKSWSALTPTNRGAHRQCNDPAMGSVMNELGFYTLAGAPRSPRDLIQEV